MTPEEIREHASTVIREHVTDVEYSSIDEMLDDELDGLDDDQRDEVCRRIDDAIRAAKVTISWPEDNDTA